jgi:hypothetical protein
MPLKLPPAEALAPDNDEESGKSVFPLNKERKKKVVAPPALLPEESTIYTKKNSAKRLYGLLRDIRVNAQYFQESLIEIRKKKILDSKQDLGEETKRLIDHIDEVFGRTQMKIMECLTSIGELINEDSILYDKKGDEISHVGFLWYMISTNWSQVKKEGEQIKEYEVFGHVDELIHLLSEVIYHADLVTIPTRTNQHLKTVRIGQPLDFHKTFQDEMPKDELRVPHYSLKILKYMHEHPGSVNGVVDIKNGLIFKADPCRLRRWSSYLVILALFGLGAIIIPKGIPFLGSYLELRDWSGFSDKILLRAYLFVALGGLAHIGIDVLKQIRTSGKYTFKALEDLALWIHIKEVPILVGIFTLFLGTLILAFSFEEIGWKTAFFVGYSIDSVIDLFLQRFGTSGNNLLYIKNLERIS